MEKVVAYVFYLAVSAILTVAVGHSLHRNGLPFILNAFNGNAILAQSINHLLLTGFYLINFGFVALALKIHSPLGGLDEAFEVLSVKLGVVLLVLGGMHFFNMHMIHKLRRRTPAAPLNGPYATPLGQASAAAVRA